MSENWTGQPCPCFEHAENTGDWENDIMDCQEEANKREIWDCAYLLAGGTWKDCPEGGASKRLADPPAVYR